MNERRPERTSVLGWPPFFFVFDLEVSPPLSVRTPKKVSICALLRIFRAQMKVLVTGSSSSIGSEAAWRFDREGETALRFWSIASRANA
jgi:hypothetical protein